MKVTVTFPTPSFKQRTLNIEIQSQLEWDALYEFAGMDCSIPEMVSNAVSPAYGSAIQQLQVELRRLMRAVNASL